MSSDYRFTKNPAFAGFFAYGVRGFYDAIGGAAAEDVSSDVDVGLDSSVMVFLPNIEVGF